MKRYFTFDEVNQLIPQLEYHFQKLLSHKQEMAKVSVRLKAQGLAPQLFGELPESLAGEALDWQQAVQQHYREFKNHIFAIGNLGAEIKDLELGRVEFLSQWEGEDATLIWQLGVTELPHPESLESEELEDLGGSLDAQETKQRFDLLGSYL